MFERYNSLFSYVDDLLAIALLVLLVYVSIREGRTVSFRNGSLLLILIITYGILGSIGSVVYGYQNAYWSIVGGFLALKGLIIIVCSYKLSEFGLLSIEYVDINVVRIITVIVALWQLIAQLFPLYIYEFSAWDLCAKAVLLMAFIFAKWERKRIDYVMMALLWILLITTFRSKGYGAVAASIIIFVWVIILRKNVKLKELLLGGLLLLAVGWRKFYIFYIEGIERTYSRPLLFKTSFDVANDYFPIGTGWGTFCSYVSAVQYSPVYFLYGLSEHRELGVEKKLYLMDAYWPEVLAETGWIGFGIIVAVYIWMFVKLQKVFRVDVKKYAAGVFLYVYFLITTIEETGLMQPVLMGTYLLFGMILGCAQYEELGDKIDGRKS